jgi:hypothetical protein
MEFLRRHRACALGYRAGYLPDICKTKEVRQQGLRAFVFVGTVGMQAIPATPHLGIDQRHRKIVAPQEPIERALGFGLPG